VGAVMIVPMAAVGLTRGKAGWLRIERIIILLFFIVVGIGTIVNLTYLIRAIVQGHEGIDGWQLLVSSVGVWITNILVFSLLYWQMDCGGPEMRASKVGKKPDWLFSNQGDAKEVVGDWHPVFVDYLFLGFNTATAFSPTDTLPLTSRARMLMMIESMISLTTIVVVAARAINILGA
jgi:hypothetical protein